MVHTKTRKSTKTSKLTGPIGYNDLRNAFIGFGSGLAIALGGAFKDSPYEGFEIDKFFRSPIVGAIVGPFVGRFVTNDPYAVFFMSIAGERLVVEAYKIGRARMPAKFELGEWGQRKCCECPDVKDSKPIW